MCGGNDVYTFTYCKCGCGTRVIVFPENPWVGVSSDRATKSDVADIVFKIGEEEVNFFCFITFSISGAGRVAQWLETVTGNHRFESSNPTTGAKEFVCT